MATCPLHQFCYPCPDLKSLCIDLKSLSQFVIFLPRFENPRAAHICNLSCPDFWSLKPAPIYNPFIASFCNLKKFFPLLRFHHFGTGVWAWITFDVFGIWYLKLTLVLINLNLATDDIIIWYCFGIEIRAWITHDLVVQFWVNFVSENFGMIAKKWSY